MRNMAIGAATAASLGAILTIALFLSWWMAADSVSIQTGAMTKGPVGEGTKTLIRTVHDWYSSVSACREPNTSRIAYTALRGLQGKIGTTLQFSTTKQFSFPICFDVMQSDGFQNYALHETSQIESASNVKICR
jgi:hypothetical protein